MTEPLDSLSDDDARARLARDGPNEVPEHRTSPLLLVARKFWGLSAWMLELIVLLSLLLGKRTDAAIAAALLVVNALLSFLQERRASAAVRALRQQLQVQSRVCRSGIWKTVPARELVVGDRVRVRAGDIVPADVLLADGGLAIDRSALTGESRTVRAAAGEPAYAGAIVRRGEATATVTATGARTYFGRTTELVQTARPHLHIDDVTGRLVRWLFLIVGVLVGATLVLSFLRGLPIVEILPLALVLLMSAVPVALPVMFTVSAAVGAMALGRRGVLMTHMAAVEDAATMDVLCADKTGTLTANRLSLAGLAPRPGWTDDDVVRLAAWASNAANQDPIDLACLAAAAERRLVDGTARVISFLPFSPDTRRTEAVVDTGERRVRAIKGALRTVAGLAGLDAEAISALERDATARAVDGSRAIAVATGRTDGRPALAGLAFLRDAPRPDARGLVDRLRSLGVRVLMLTGDALPAAQAVGRELGLDRVMAEVLPEDKFRIVRELQAEGHVVGMTGDGVNDAPALRQAEVGIAVSGATDVAKGAASLVMTTEGLTGVVDVVQTGRAIYQRVLTWIVNKVSRTILKSAFVVVAFVVTGRFVISALGMILLVFMTDFAKVSLSTDRVRASDAPETWNIGPLVAIAAVVGIVMTGEALGLLAVVWQRWQLGVSPGELRTFSFLLLLFLALGSVLSIRERRAFWRSRPSWILATSLAADLVVGGAIGLVGLGELAPIHPARIAVIAAYAAACCLGPNDWIKTALVARFWRRDAGDHRAV